MADETKIALVLTLLRGLFACFHIQVQSLFHCYVIQHDKDDSANVAGTGSRIHLAVGPRAAGSLPVIDGERERMRQRERAGHKTQHVWELLSAVI